MSLEVKLSWVLRSVELVNVDLVLVGRCEEMTAVGELDLSTTLDGNLFKGTQTPRKDIHHPHFVSEADDNVKARRVKSHRVGLIRIYLTYF